MRLWELEEGDGVDPHRFRPIENHEPIEDPPEDQEEVLIDFGAPPPPAPPAPPPPPPVVRQQPAPPAANGIRVNARVQQGLARPRPVPNVLERGPPVQGLQRFLQMVENDEEDEWDSDELDDQEEGAWEIPVR